MNENQWSVAESCHATGGKNCVVSRDQPASNFQVHKYIQVCVYLSADVMQLRSNILPTSYEATLKNERSYQNNCKRIGGIIVMTHLTLFVP